MVEAPHYVGIEGFFTRVAPGPVSAVVTQRNRFGQGNVETGRPSDPGSDLGDFERVREAGAHVVIGEYEDLSLARQATKGTRMKYSVTVTLEAGTKIVGLFFTDSVTGSTRPRGAAGEKQVQLLFALGETARELRALRRRDPYGRVRVLVRDRDVVRTPFVTFHGRGPTPIAIRYRFTAHVFHHAPAP